MALYVWQRSITDRNGVVRPFASIEVKDAITGVLVQLYEDIDGEDALGNPFAADEEGFARFYARTGRYRITATYGSDSRIWENERLGTTGDEIVNLRTPSEIAAGVTPTSYQYLPGNLYRFLSDAQIADYRAGTASLDLTAALTAWASVPGIHRINEPGVARITSAIPLVGSSTYSAVEGAVIRQYTANASVLSATSETDISIDGLTLYAVGSFSSTYNGNGLSASQCQRITMKGTRVLNHRGFGILLDRCSECLIDGNRLTDADVSGATDHTDVAGDIALLDSSNCIVRGNLCISGNGIGVNVQTVQNNTSCIDNIVEGNTIRNCLIYGINLYRGGTGTTHRGTVVKGNIVDDVSGEIPELTDGLVFGNGIYAVQASDFVIEGNEVNSTHSYGGSVVDQLAPAAIGTTICGAHTIRGNVIRNAGYNGISVRNPTGAAVGNQPAIIEGNTIRAVARFAIEVQDRANVTIRGNNTDTAANTVITVGAPTLTTAVPGIVVEGNTVRNGSAAGIFVTYATSPVISNNLVDTVGGDGIHWQNCADAVVSGNNVLAPGDDSYGIANHASNARSVITGNNVRGKGSEPDYAYYFGSWWKRNTTNTQSNCAAAYLGDYIPDSGAVPSSGTNVQGDVVYASNVSAGGFVGWVCTSGGTPGTWKTFGAVTP